MEQINENKSYQIKFEGKGSEYFGIFIVNTLLTLITLGIYYPWAKAKLVKYLYGVTSIEGNRFSFNGTGKEMFIGLLKFNLMLLALIVVVMSISLYGDPYLVYIGAIAFYIGFLCIIPLAIHGSLRYRMSRTSLRGIRFGYRGNRRRLAIDFIKYLLLTLITLGIYSTWMEVKLRTYIIGNIRYGNVEGKYQGSGGELLWINLKGLLLSILTLGIYMSWFQKDLYAYYFNNTSFHKNGQMLRMQTTITGLGLFILNITNMLILIFTLGIGFPWIEIRTMRYITENIHLEGNIDLESIIQTEENYTDATGEGALDFFDLDLF